MNKKIKKIINMKRKKKIVCLTAYSKNFAEIIDKYADIILVGDSLGSVLYNYETTRKVTLENMIKHSCSVKKGVKKTLMVVDMPYQTYKNKSQALKNAKKIIFAQKKILNHPTVIMQPFIQKFFINFLFDFFLKVFFKIFFKLIFFI